MSERGASGLVGAVAIAAGAGCTSATQGRWLSGWAGSSPGGGPHLNVNRIEMARPLPCFGAAAHNGDTLLFYFAGHGIAFNGDNWLLPVDDTDIKEQGDVPDFALFSRSVVTLTEQHSGGTNVLDSCRNHPLDHASGCLR